MAALSGRRGLTIILALMVVVCGALGTVAVMTLRHVASTATAQSSPNASPQSVAAEPVDSPQALPSSDPPSPSPSPSPSRKPKPKPSRKPIKVAKPPAPPKKPASCPSHKVGTAVSRATVKAALTDAAALRPWADITTTPPPPDVSVPLNLVEAVAWQETGWQSNLVSCIGAIGLMQVTQPTADFINSRFQRKDDINTVAGNAALGSAYLQWLVKYFGDVYFQGSYDLTVTDPNNPTLLDAVIAAYNVGFGAVDTPSGLKIPNRAYVNNVEYFMKKAPWG